MKQFATITVIGRDKTGVVARVTSYLFEQKANIEALEEQVTRGQFSMAIQASWKPRQLNAGTVRAGFDRLAKSLGMEIKLRFTEPHRRQRMAILVTRESHCLEGLLASARAGRLNAEPALLLSNRRDLEPVAQSDGVPFLVIPWENRADAEDRARVLEESLGRRERSLGALLTKLERAERKTDATPPRPAAAATGALPELARRLGLRGKRGSEAPPEDPAEARLLRDLEIGLARGTR